MCSQNTTRSLALTFLTHLGYIENMPKNAYNWDIRFIHLATLQSILFKTCRRTPKIRKLKKIWYVCCFTH